VTNTPTITLTPTITCTPTPTGSATITPVIDDGLNVLCNRFDPDQGEMAKIYFRLTAPSRATLTIYNLAGERVAVLFDGMAGTQNYYLDWDGTNRNDQPVASGLYLVVLSTPSGHSFRKVVVIH
jgi:hypothetical protein